MTTRLDPRRDTRRNKQQDTRRDTQQDTQRDARHDGAILGTLSVKLADFYGENFCNGAVNTGEKTTILTTFGEKMRMGAIDG